MSLKKVILALALASFTGIAWLGLSASPAAANPLTKLNQEITLSAKGQHHGGKGHHHGKHHHGGKGHHGGKHHHGAKKS